VKVLRLCEPFLKIFPRWECCSMDVEGHLRGVIFIWNPLIDNLKPSSSRLGILLEGRIKGFDNMIIIINCYDPYSQRKEFWENVVGSGILKDLYLIFGGDINFNFPTSEVWGSNPWMDPLSDLFNKLLRRQTS